VEGYLITNSKCSIGHDVYVAALDDNALLIKKLFELLNPPLENNY